MTEFKCCAHAMHAFQVQQASGDWEDVPMPAGHVVVLPGYTLERATCGLVKATVHRVVSDCPPCMQETHLAFVTCSYFRHIGPLNVIF